MPRRAGPLVNPTEHPSTGGVRFDFTVNLGHILQFVGIAMAGVMAWRALDTRVTVLEQTGLSQVALAVEKEQRLTDSLTYIKEQVTELRRVVERLSDRVDRRNTDAAR